MKSFLLSLAGLVASVTGSKFVICDNDWAGSASFIPPLLYLNAGYEVVRR